MTEGYKDLDVWHRAMDLVEAVYRLSARFPSDERFGLTSQIRRAAVSVPSNIAEGHSRGGGDYRRFVDIAYGSLCEVETQLALAVRLSLVEEDEAILCMDTANEVGRMLNGLRRFLRR